MPLSAPMDLVPARLLERTKEGKLNFFITATKLGAIVGGQTSCKVQEVKIFEKYLPPDVDIVSCHSLHGPTVNPAGQPLVCEPLTELCTRQLMCCTS